MSKSEINLPHPQSAYLKQTLITALISNSTLRLEPQVFWEKMASIIQESVQAPTRWPKSQTTLGTRLVIHHSVIIQRRAPTAQLGPRMNQIESSYS